MINIYESPTITNVMECWFDGKTIRNITSFTDENGFLEYKGFFINKKWFDEYDEYDEIMELFNINI